MLSLLLVASLSLLTSVLAEPPPPGAQVFWLFTSSPGGKERSLNNQVVSFAKTSDAQKCTTGPQPVCEDIYQLGLFPSIRDDLSVKNAPSFWYTSFVDTYGGGSTTRFSMHWKDSANKVALRQNAQNGFHDLVLVTNLDPATRPDGQNLGWDTLRWDTGPVTVKDGAEETWGKNRRWVVYKPKNGVKGQLNIALYDGVTAHEGFEIKDITLTAMQD